MKPNGPERNLIACIAALLAAVVPLFFSACRSDVIAPLDASAQQASAPTIKSIMPDTAPSAGGTAVTISGSNFSSDTESTPPLVSFGGVAAKSVTMVSSSQVIAMAPPHASGKVSVQLTNADGITSSIPGAFTYAAASSLSVSSVTPNSGGTAGGTVVIITGSNFASGAKVSFGGSLASSVSFLSANQLKATTPAHVSGSVNVAVANPDSTTAMLPGAFTFGTASSLTVSNVAPFSGPAAGGTKVTISGANFQKGVSVMFGGLPAGSVTLSNSSTIVAVTPQHSSGSATVTITNTNGQSASWASNYTFHSIDLLWDAPSTSPVNVDGYNIYRGNSSSGPFAKLNGSTPLSDTSFIDATVEGNTTYYYEVKAVDSDGTESPPAGPVPATTSR
ncbi:MAG TPA: IPT/TIG domain-containing protein [Terriglobia bacterium]|nr:IPT/TIG domain-containing protein [Terriglobia bacterium]